MVPSLFQNEMSNKAIDGTSPIHSHHHPRHISLDSQMDEPLNDPDYF
jgi:hypothetical protein